MQVCPDMTRSAYSLMAKRFSMKLRSQVASALALFLLPLVLLSCSPLTAEPQKATAEAAKPVIQDATPPSLPVRYQTASYLVDAGGRDSLDSQADETIVKVGARISSKSKVALKDIMKPLASQKKLNISWASDVNQDALVDVDIQANDDFYKAIEHLLRQLDYFYEIEGSTLVIKYRETKQFQIAMPFTKQDFSTGTGGNGPLASQPLSANSRCWPSSTRSTPRPAISRISRRIPHLLSLSTIAPARPALWRAYAPHVQKRRQIARRPT